jgi:hypothetical protein
MSNSTKKITLALLTAAFAVGAAGAAAAETVGAAGPGNAGELCHGKDGKGRHGERFQRADKNSDGFLTESEVGAERWARIKVADANNDKKVSRDELQQAFKDGKLGRRHGPKNKS